MGRADAFHRLLLVIAGIALLAAAALVIHLQQQSARRHEQQTTVMLEQLCRQISMGMTQRLEDIFGDAVFSTLEGIGHPDLRRWDLPRVAAFFEAGRHPYVDRYFLWGSQIGPEHRDEVLFYRGEGTPSGIVSISHRGGTSELYSDPEAGAAIKVAADRFTSLRRSFAVVEETLNGRPHQIIIHYLWDDERRDHVFALIGYTIDLARVRAELFADLLSSGALVLPAEKEVQPRLTVQDSEGDVVFGALPDAGVPSATSTFELLFFPSRSLRPWLATRPPRATWRLTVSAPFPRSGSAAAGGYWLFAAVVFLILIGFLCAVTLDRRSRKLSEMQAEFVANVSHQLKTPLALLSGAAETLGQGRIRTPEKLREYGTIVSTQVTRLSTLVDQTILCAIADGRVGGLQFELVDAVSVTRAAVDEFRRGLPDTIDLKFTTNGPVPLVKADPAALEQVVWNLLENAFKYGNAEDNRIHVAVSSQDRKVTISVRDHGDGIRESDLPRIFDRFYRGGANGHRPRGFGLGLSYAQKVAKAHRGELSVASEIGRGSEFRVIIPAA